MAFAVGCLLFFFFLVVCKNAQAQCFTYTVKVCIDGSDYLHIQGNSMWWQHVNHQAPGAHSGCPGSNYIFVNGNQWAPWNSPYTLPNSTTCHNMTWMVNQCFHGCSLTQAPSASNNWETIYYFNDDPPGGPHMYEIAFTFCPVSVVPGPGSNSPVCEGDTLRLTAANISGATFSWTGPNGFTANQQNPVIANPTAAHSGTYTVTATVGGCPASASIPVTVAPIPSTSLTTLNESCYFGNDGMVDLTVNVGSVPYSFSWSNGHVSEDLLNVGAGTYYVTLVDGNGCQAMDTAVVGRGLGFVIVDTCRWVGDVDSNWFNPCNWKKDAVPDTSCHVLIPGGTLHNPYIGGDTAECKTLITIHQNGGHVTYDAANGGKLIKMP